MDVFSAALDSGFALLRDAAIVAAYELGVFDAAAPAADARGVDAAAPAADARGVDAAAPAADARGLRAGAPTRRMRALLAVLDAIGAFEGPPPPRPARDIPREGWGRLADVIRTDQPLAIDPAYELRYQQHLLGASAPAARELVARLPAWLGREPRSLVDLGGGAGAYTAAFLDAYPAAHATLVDRAEVIAIARAALARFGDRVRFVAGDARAVVGRAANASAGDGIAGAYEGASAGDGIAGAHDVALLANVLHLHGPDACAALCAAAARAGDLVVVKDLRPDTLQGRFFALGMAIYTEAGDVYAADDIRGWLPELVSEHRLEAADEGFVLSAISRPDELADPAIPAGFARVLARAAEHLRASAHAGSPSAAHRHERLRTVRTESAGIPPAPGPYGVSTDVRTEWGDTPPAPGPYGVSTGVRTDVRTESRCPPRVRGPNDVANDVRTESGDIPRTLVRNDLRNDVRTESGDTPRTLVRNDLRNDVRTESGDTPRTLVRNDVDNDVRTEAGDTPRTLVRNDVDNDVRTESGDTPRTLVRNDVGNDVRTDTGDTPRTLVRNDLRNDVRTHFEDTEHDPAGLLLAHYTRVMPARRAEQFALPIFHVPLDWARLPRLSAAIDRLNAILDDAGITPDAKAAGVTAAVTAGVAAAVTAGVAAGVSAGISAGSPPRVRPITRAPTLAALYERTYYGRIMPLLYGDAHLAREGDPHAIIDRYLVAPLMHELCHLGPERPPIDPPHLDECIGGWLAIHVHAAFGEDDAIYGSPWLAQVGQAIARTFGIRAVVRAHAGLEPLPAWFTRAAEQLGWRDWTERRSLHLLADTMDPAPWVELARSRGVPDDPAFDRLVVRDALRAMCVVGERVVGERAVGERVVGDRAIGDRIPRTGAGPGLRTRVEVPTTPIRIADGWMTTARRGDVDRVDPRYWVPIRGSHELRITSLDDIDALAARLVE